MKITDKEWLAFWKDMGTDDGDGYRFFHEDADMDEEFDPTDPLPAFLEVPDDQRLVFECPHYVDAAEFADFKRSVREGIITKDEWEALEYRISHERNERWELDLCTVIKRWRKSLDTEVISVTVPKKRKEEFLSLLKLNKFKVLSR